MSDADPVLVNGLRLYHGLQHPRWVHELASYEPEVTRVFEERVAPGMTVLDVGANIGYFSLLAARLVGESGAVWAFEPAPHAVELLRRNVRENGYDGRIHVVPEAIDRAPGTASLHLNLTAHFLSSFYEAASRHPFEEGRYARVEVHCTSLDAWAERQQWPHVDLVKVDVEGAETAALGGMIELSRRNPHLTLIAEFSVRHLRHAGVTVDEFSAALHGCGFRRVTWIDGEMREFAMPADVPDLLRESYRRRGVLRLNLLCEKGTALEPSASAR
jgi:FkbM family methyltransferase